MILLSVSGLAKSFGDRLLFDDVGFMVKKGERVALIGDNGAGKTTLLKLITGNLTPDRGNVHIGSETVIGAMAQQVSENLDATLYDEVVTVFDHLRAIEEQLGEVTSQLEEAGDARLIERQHRLSEEYEAGGGYTYRSRTRSTLLGLGFREDDLELPLRALSGGQRSKALLAQMLSSNANLLLLDEPTNHLDIESVEWLENHLSSFSGGIIVISHDRYFLDRIATRTMALEHERLHAYDGNYSEYLLRKAQQRAIEERHYDQNMREIRRIEGIIAQQRQFNRERNIRMAESKQKTVDKLKAALVKPKAEQSGIRFAFEADAVGGNDVLSANGLSIAFGGSGGKPLFEDVELELRRGEHVFLLGPNGCGKTTLLKILDRQTVPTRGVVQLGAKVRIGYYDQTQSHLNLDDTVLNNVWNAYPALNQTQVRGALAAFLFKGDDVVKVARSLSGGERARVELLKLMLSRANLLLLDEPTNHLDLKSREAFEAALDEYDGTLLIVSHDRYLINKLSSRIVYFDRGGLSSLLGGYDEYAQRPRQDEEVDESIESDGKREYLRTKQQQSEIRKAKTRAERLQRAIETAEDRLEELNSDLSDFAADYERVLAISTEIGELESALEWDYEEWAKAQEELETLNEETE